jgi:hypothetical protein
MELSAYQDLNLEGLFSGSSEVNDLLKAMQAGQITGRDTVNQSLTYEPLKLESLDKTVKLLDARMKDVRLWKALPKDTAYNTVEEFLQLESYGTFTGGFYGEGETPDVQDSKYKRRANYIKYLQVAGEVTLQAQVVKSVVDNFQKEIDNKTMWIIKAASYYLTRANSAMVSKEFDGIYAQHASIGGGSGDLYTSLDQWQNSVSVIDLRGASLKQTNIVDGSTNIQSLYGNADTLFAPPTVLDGLSKDFIARQRIIMGGSGFTGTAGTIIKSVDTQFGDVGVFSDIFMKQDAPKTLPASATSSKAPSAPTINSGALTAADPASRFATGEAHTGALGTAYYAVSGVNEYGESALTVFSNTVPITLTAGLSVDLNFTDGGGVFPASAYQIYRSKVTTATNATTGSVKFYPIFRISVAQKVAGYDGAAAGIVRDRNRFLPDSESAFLYENSSDIIDLQELMPISKLNLAVTGPSNRFMLYYFLAPRLAQPKKLIRYINIGPFTS